MCEMDTLFVSSEQYLYIFTTIINHFGYEVCANTNWL